MKKIISLILTVCILLTAAGCVMPQPQVKKISVVTTVFPVYDWVKNIVGEKSECVELTMLLDSGVDMHSFQPSAEDIIKISDCDMFIYVGGASDRWVSDALSAATNENMAVVNLLEELGDLAKTEELKEGMQGEEEEEYDEHVWLSVKNAQKLCNRIAYRLTQLDGDNAALYKSGALEYMQKLKALDGEFEEAVKGVHANTLLFADRFPFRYLCDDYGLDYFAAFSGCSAESEASFETVRFLAEKTDELGLKYVLTLEGGSNSIADAVIGATSSKSAEALAMDSMQSVDGSAVENGADYIDIMKKNLEVIRKLSY